MFKLNPIVKFFKKIIFLLVILLCEVSIAHEGHSHGPSVATSVSFDELGTLWRVREQQGFIIVDSSNDQGMNFSKKINVITELQAEYFDSGNADIDLYCAIKSKIFIQGKGYFSKLIVEIRKRLNLYCIETAVHD